MNTPAKTFTITLTVALLFGMGALTLKQRHDLDQLREEKQALELRADELKTQLAKQAAEWERLANSLTAQPPMTNAVSDPAQQRELLRLRSEVGHLRREHQDVEQSRRDEMAAAQARIPGAEAELSRMTNMLAVGAIGAREVSAAQFAVQLLKAQAAGDKAEEARVRVQQAETDLGFVGKMRAVGMISQSEYDEAVQKVVAAKAALN